VSPSEAASANRAYCETIARDHERDRWLATLFAPEAARPHLQALIAFDHELGGLRARVRDPRAGEIRLVWWREALTGERPGEALGHPIAASLLEAIATFGLPLNLFENAIAARQFDLYDDPMPSLHDLEGYGGETCSALFQLSALILAEGRDVGAADASGHAGVAFAIMRLLRTLPQTSARGQVFPPRDILERHGVSPENVRGQHEGAGMSAALQDLIGIARGHLAEAEAKAAALPGGVVPAYAPLAVVPLYLEKAALAARAPFTTPIEVARWRRQWALWRWSRRRK
jgi:phytoene synthase